MADAGLTWEDQRVVSRDEVAKHNTISDFWLVLHGIVFAVPEEDIKNHPGGQEIITIYAGGKDGGVEFLDADHEKKTINEMESYRIGVLEGFEHRKNTRLSSITEKTLESEKGENGEEAETGAEPEHSEAVEKLKQYGLPLIFVSLSLAALALRR